MGLDGLSLKPYLYRLPEYAPAGCSNLNSTGFAGVGLDWNVDSRHGETRGDICRPRCFLDDRECGLVVSGCGSFGITQNCSQEENPRVLRLSAIHTQHLLLDRHVVLDGSHAADAARHLDRPGCVSLGSHRAAQSNRTVEGLDADSARV